MPKSSKSKKPAARTRDFYGLHPWQYRIVDKERVEITAYVEASGKWETILTAHQTSGDGAEAVATYVTAIINQYQSKADLLQEAITALQSVMDEGLNYSTEQAADRVLTSIKKRAS